MSSIFIFGAMLALPWTQKTAIAMGTNTPSFQINHTTTINKRTLLDWGKKDSSLEFYQNIPDRIEPFCLTEQILFNDTLYRL